jgi:putative Holliday junction resolvase
MGRILAIDYGRKRVGLAVTDSNKIIANRLDTISTHEIWNFLVEYFKKEEIEKVVVGYPKTLNNEASEAVKYINPFIKKFRQQHSGISLELIDERFTSKMAMRTMIDAGLKKKKRQDKKLVDGVSATIILQNYLEHQRNT